MDFSHIVDRLSKLDDGAGQSKELQEFTTATAEQAAGLIRDDKCKIVDLIKGLNAVLTNGSYEIRSRGVELLAQVVKKLPTSLLTEKEIELMSEFVCLRLIDHKSMERSALECLSYFVDCDNKPALYNKQLMDFIKTKAQLHKMEAKSRRRVYETMLKKFVAERKRRSNTLDGDFIYSLVTILEGENNPDNLMVCFGMISFILKNFDELDPYIDDIFEWLTSYYPIDYTPSDDKAEHDEGDDQTTINIQRADLVEALYECFYANPLNSENLQTLLLEKLESNVMSSKLESLECLIKCYNRETSFPLASIVKYNSTLWTALRMSCLRKIDTIEPKLLETCLRTLTSLAERLSKDDGDMYFTFVTDMHEELAIAFRKPEMDLFEPAARLVTHAILPSLVGFNYVLEKLLPIALNALEAGELRPLSGLAYVFEKLHQRHGALAQLKDDLEENLTKLVLKVTALVGTQQDACRLLDALFSQRVALSDDALRQVASKLWASQISSGGTTTTTTTSQAVEKCLALLCAQYNQFSLITSAEVAPTGPDHQKCDLNSLLMLIYNFNLLESSDHEDVSKFCVYLRILTLELDKSTGAQLEAFDQLVLNDALTRMRDQLEQLATSENTNTTRRVCEQSAIIHAIVLNKLAPTSAHNQILMKFFSSAYCQRLVSALDDERAQRRTLAAYLPHVKWIFKSLVIRNHQLATPLVNLVLNCITSDKVHADVAREASLVFSFVLAPPPSPEFMAKNTDSTTNTTTSELLFSTQRHYQVFSLYKQKFYMQTLKEIRLRFGQISSAQSSGGENSSSTTSGLLIFSIASQLAHLPLAVYKRDHEWLIRQLLRVLSPSAAAAAASVVSVDESNVKKESATSALFQAIYACLEGLIHRDLCEGLVPFLPSLIELNLRNAQEARSLVLRRQALVCLAKIATTFKESDLLMYRPGVVDKLRACLADKKRLVRQAAGETRLRWVTIAQPIGGP